MADKFALPGKKTHNSFLSTAGATYEIRVADRLGCHIIKWFDGMTIMVDESMTPTQTIIRTYIGDQAALYGLISRVRDLGLSLVSVNIIESVSENS